LRSRHQPRPNETGRIVVQGVTWRIAHELFLAADIRVAASDSVFSQGEVARRAPQIDPTGLKGAV
jgi:hypothetical protein